MKELLYFIVIVFANTLGAISGMGGGVIIRPLFEFLAQDSIVSITFYSTIAVFVMSIVSTIRQKQNGVRVQLNRLLALAIGSLIGGVIGDSEFHTIIKLIGRTQTQSLQIILMILMLVFCLVSANGKIQQFNYGSLIAFGLCGILLGTVSSFLGIGGGPINVSLLMTLFSIPVKEATVYSIATIFFSQLSKVVSLFLIQRFGEFRIETLIVVILAAIIGGIVGAQLNKILSSEKVLVVFKWIVSVMILLNLYNLFHVIWYMTL